MASLRGTGSMESQAIQIGKCWLSSRKENWQREYLFRTLWDYCQWCFKWSLKRMSWEQDTLKEFFQRLLCVWWYSGELNKKSLRGRNPTLWDKVIPTPIPSQLCWLQDSQFPETLSECRKCSWPSRVSSATAQNIGVHATDADSFLENAKITALPVVFHTFTSDSITIF